MSNVLYLLEQKTSGDTALAASLTIITLLSCIFCYSVLMFGTSGRSLWFVILTLGFSDTLFPSAGVRNSPCARLPFHHFIRRPTPRVPHLGLRTEWVTPLFTIFQIPSQVFGLAGCPAFSPAITGLQGFSNGAFEEITLFSPSSREKTGDVWPTAHIVNHPHRAWAPSDAFGY